jgi:hypothetical protein
MIFVVMVLVAHDGIDLRRFRIVFNGVCADSIPDVRRCRIGSE